MNTEREGEEQPHLRSPGESQGQQAGSAISFEQEAGRLKEHGLTASDIQNLSYMLYVIVLGSPNNDLVEPYFWRDPTLDRGNRAAVRRLAHRRPPTAAAYVDYYAKKSGFSPDVLKRWLDHASIDLASRFLSNPTAESSADRNDFFQSAQRIASRGLRASINDHAVVTHWFGVLSDIGWCNPQMPPIIRETPWGSIGRGAPLSSGSIDDIRLEELDFI